MYYSSFNWLVFSVYKYVTSFVTIRCLIDIGLIIFRLMTSGPEQLVYL